MSSLTADANAQHATGPRWPRAIATLAIYVLFAAVVYVVQGPEPTLSIDHISYFKLADEIRIEWPRGDYYATINSVRFYSVLLAYLYDFTGEHVASLKMTLAFLTVAYLLAFHLFMGLLTKSHTERVAFSLASAMFVSFGASIWGMTDFAASLNRTIVIPFIVLLVWAFFRWFHSPWRYAVYPALVLISLLHLSALHVFLVFAAFEVLDYVFRRRFRFTRDLLYLGIAAVASVATQFGIEMTGAGTSRYITYTLKVAMPSIPIAPPADTRTKETIARDQAETAAALAAVTGVVEQTVAAPAPKAPAKGATKPAGKKETAAAEPEAAKMPPAPPSAEVLRRTQVAPDKLSIKHAWDIELFAFPWRNMPPTLATMVTIASSFGLILLLAIAGAVRVFRGGVGTGLDRAMVAFAAGVVLAAYGLQTVLWLLRDSLNIFPVNFEEIRAINMLMVPAVYFAYRLYSLAPPVGRLSPRAVKVLILVAFVLQPILLVRTLPASWREGIIEAAIDARLLKRTDAPRMMYARHFLGMSGEGTSGDQRRFYYSARGAVKWLDTNADPQDVVFTNIDDFIIARTKTRGTFLNIISMDVWDVRRGAWVRSLDSVDQIMQTRNTERILHLAREVGAKYAVVTWKVPDALYSDGHYTILEVQ